MEQTRKFGVKPVSIANLNRGFVRIRELCEEWNKTVQKLVTILKSRFIEERELENNETEFRAKDVHRPQKLRQFSVAANKSSIVSNCLRCLDCEGEAFGSSGGPVPNCLNGRAGIEGRVHLDCREMFGVETQIVCGSHPLGIERSCPARGRKRGRFKQNWCEVH